MRIHPVVTQWWCFKPCSHIVLVFSSTLCQLELKCKKLVFAFTSPLTQWWIVTWQKDKRYVWTDLCRQLRVALRWRLNVLPLNLSRRPYIKASRRHVLNSCRWLAVRAGAVVTTSKAWLINQRLLRAFYSATWQFQKNVHTKRRKVCGKTSNFCGCTSLPSFFLECGLRGEGWQHCL